MKTRLIAIALSFLSLSGASVSSALAATIVNKDAEAQVVKVTEGGSKSDVVVEAGAQVVICPVGCFLTMPSGDRETLSGDETIEIINGSAVIK